MPPIEYTSVLDIRETATQFLYPSLRIPLSQLKNANVFPELPEVLEFFNILVSDQVEADEITDILHSRGHISFEVFTSIHEIQRKLDFTLELHDSPQPQSRLWSPNPLVIYWASRKYSDSTSLPRVKVIDAGSGVCRDSVYLAQFNCLSICIEPRLKLLQTGANIAARYGISVYTIEGNITRDKRISNAKTVKHINEIPANQSCLVLFKADISSLTKLPKQITEAVDLVLVSRMHYNNMEEDLFIIDSEEVLVHTFTTGTTRPYNPNSYVNVEALEMYCTTHDYKVVKSEILEYYDHVGARKLSMFYAAKNHSVS